MLYNCLKIKILYFYVHKLCRTITIKFGNKFIFIFSNFSKNTNLLFTFKKLYMVAFLAIMIFL